MKIPSSPLVIILAHLFAFSAAAHGAISVIGPAGEGNGEVGEAINGSSSVNGSTIQFYLPASALTAVANQSLTGLAFRLDSTYDPVLPGFGYQSLILAISPSSAGSLTSTNLAANSPSPTTVFNNSFFYQSGSFSSGGSPNSFGSYIKFDTPYAYSTGDLVLTLRHSVPVNENGTTLTVPGYFSSDADNSSGLSVLVASNRNATTGNFWGYVPVIAVTTNSLPNNFVPTVPEPGSALLLLSASLMGFRRRRSAC